MDYGSLLYGPIYEMLGVVGSITLTDTAETEIDVTVMDKTSGLAALLADNSITVQTIRALAAVRVTELTATGVARDDLKGATIIFNSSTWTIHSTRAAPSPTGEGEGELYLLLEAQS